MPHHPLSIAAATLIAASSLSIAAAPITSTSAPYPTHGTIEQLDAALDGLLAADAKMENLGGGFNWSEGPVWRSRTSDLLFSDVPENIVYRWKDGAGISVFLEPSGYTGDPAAYDGRERGSNGLTLDLQGKLLLAQHGNRQIARLNDDNQTFTALADRFDGKRFSSPNDLCVDKAGNIYFTDPPYGMAKSATQETAFHGVYRRAVDGKVTLISNTLERPNGIALSLDEQTLYVANSHGPRPIILAIKLHADGTPCASQVLWDSTELIARTKRGGGMDGLKIDEKGNLWATGPGGVLILSPEGKHLGSLLTERATANCGFGDADGRTLYITADDLLLRVKTKVKGSVVR
jgi:gluconolactonase